ncbi:MAG: hypothetical protein NWF09_00795 [Candidatus Bathyarchaeota archaeon]|nr:hypothetical protein [Candidatus Bathyarchaeota archaeon]
MQKKMVISIAAVAALMLAVLAVNLVMAATSTVVTSNVKANAIEAVKPISQETSSIISPEQAENVEQLKELVPATLEEAESNIHPVKHRFLMWTNDGVHIMWGIYGNGTFVGTDNLGKRCWGIYGRGIFAGLYDGIFFWGKYCNGSWKAEYLFGLRQSHGKYVLFPALTTTSSAAPP